MTTTSNEKTFNAWVIYQALYAHFTRNYDYFKYNGKGSWNNSTQIFRQIGYQKVIYFFGCWLWKWMGSP